jgi:hypothetical protein
MKDNMTKVTDKIKKSDFLNGMIKYSTRLTEKIKESNVINGMIKESTRLTEKIKESEALNGMITESTKLTEKMKESEVLNGMIKESRLNKLLVGKGALDGLLAREVEKTWHFEREHKRDGKTQQKFQQTFRTHQRGREGEYSADLDTQERISHARFTCEQGQLFRDRRFFF